ncbi:MAG: HlyC/CorC family transporter [Candidatus Zixiibacteriota bacterium]|nr:MAG: HlyC/CorC family transporter [candidate division Zixibacteria bacterium]
MEKVDSESDGQPERSEVSGFSVRKLFKKFFGKTKTNDLTPEEREKAIEESIEQFASQVSSGDNILEEDDREMIHGVVELGETMAKEIMVPRVDMVSVELDTPMEEVIEIIRKSGHSRIPLYRNSPDEIIGIIYAKDLLTHALKGEDVDLSKIARKSYFIPENIKIDDLLAQMRKEKLHIAIVVDEYGGTSGLVTMEDIIEEIVGEIEDEYDLEPPPIIKMAEGIYIVDGTVTISDLNKELELKLPEDEIETIGGLMYDLVGSLPEKGQILEYDGIKFTVHEIEGQRIVKVKINLGENKAEQQNNQP